MKTILIAFEKRTLNSVLSKECELIRLLNFNALYADQIRVLATGDKSGLVNALAEGFDCAFILGADDTEFNLFGALSGEGYVFNERGFSLNKGLVSVVPEIADEAYVHSLKEALSEKYGFFAENVTFKLYGAEFSKVEGFCQRINGKKMQCHLHADDVGGDIKVVLTYGEASPKAKVDGVIREFIKTFKDYIYAEDDVSVEERLNQVLRLRNLKVCTAESMTGGLIAAKIVSVSGASDIFYEGLTTYDTLSKERRLGVSHATVSKHTVVSAPVAYEMAAGLLDSGNCTVAITITGYAGSDVHPAKDDGLCFIGIGVRDEIKVFEYNFGGKRKENIQKAANAALFLAIKTVEELDGFNPYG